MRRAQGFNGGNIAGAKEVGRLVAERAKAKGINPRGVRPRRIPVPRACKGARRCCPRRRTGVLTNGHNIVKKVDPSNLQLKEQVVSINRVTKVVKGGKNMSFSALVVVGDPAAKVVGFGTGKAKEVPSAIKKGIEAAKKNLRKINVLETTIKHSGAWPVRFGTGAAEAGACR